MVQRLDIRSARYDAMSQCVLMDGRGITLAVTREALEALFGIELEPQEAVLKAIDEHKRLTSLAEIVPPDDGRVLITTRHMLTNGRHLDDQLDRQADQNRSPA